MRPHLTIVLASSLDEKIPDWISFISDKSEGQSLLREKLKPSFDKYHLDFWLTKEYPSNSLSFEKDEIESGIDKVYRVILKNTSSIPEELIDDLELIPIVEEVRKGSVGTAAIPVSENMALPVDNNYSASQRLISLHEAHYFSKGIADVKIAVLDTGIKLAHPELTHCLDSGYDFVNIIDGAGEFFGDYLDADDDPNDDIVGHGTHVAGIIAAKGKQMPMGVVPNCKIIPIKVLGALKKDGGYIGAGLVDNINVAIKWAVDKGADVINMSLGIRREGGGLPHKEVIEYAQKKGVTVVAASGNDGTEMLYYPGALDHVISVGATDESGNLAHFTSYGKVSIVAPGTNIYSSHSTGGYAFSSGTSQASPFVAGAIGLLKSYALSQGSTLSDNQLKYLLFQTADRHNKALLSRKGGYGRINLADAIKLMKYKLNRI